MKNKEEVLHQIKVLSLQKDPAFQIDTNNALTEYRHLAQNRTNITIKILSILGVIISVLSFLTALFFLNLLNEKINFLICGSIFLALALVCMKRFNTIIIDTASISLYISGVSMLLYGLDFDEINVILISCITINLCTLAIVRRYLISLLNLLCIIYSAIALVSYNTDNLLYIALTNALLVLTLVYILTQEASILSKRNFISTIYQPLRIALIFSTIATTAYIVLYHFETDQVYLSTASIALYMLSTVYALIILFIVYKITQKHNGRKTKINIPVYILIIALLATTIINPGISGAIVLILLCFYYQYRFGLSIGVIALLFFLWHFYYNLNFSLLTKSIFLMLSGLVFLAIYYVINSKKINNEKI